MAGERVTTAAGGIIWRHETEKSSKLQVLIIHRPRYDDWTFPKGKSEPGETLPATAIREIREETGLQVRLAHPLPPAVYRVSSGRKVVSYWIARAVGAEHAPFVPNHEVDELRWVRIRDARALLTYQHDVDLLDTFSDLRKKKAHKSRTLIVLRHAKASDRSDWPGDDTDRPLVRAGAHRAAALVPDLEAYGVERVVSSPALRCAQTVDPYAASAATPVRLDDRLSEDTTRSGVSKAIGQLMTHKEPIVLCSHRPTLPWVFDAIGIDGSKLAPGDGIVVHHRDGRVLATEPLAAHR